MRGGAMTFALWEWRPVPSTGDDLRKSMVPFPVREPSNVMFQLVGLLDRVHRPHCRNYRQHGRGEPRPEHSSRDLPQHDRAGHAGLQRHLQAYLALNEGGVQELYRLNAVFLESQQHYGAQDKLIYREDLQKANPYLEPPSRTPTSHPSGMRMMQVQLLRAAAHSVPGHDIPLVEKKFLAALRSTTLTVLPGPDKAPPLPQPQDAG